MVSTLNVLKETKPLKNTHKHSQKTLNPPGMAESEGIQAIVNQVAIQAVTAVMMVLRNTDMGLEL